MDFSPGCPPLQEKGTGQTSMGEARRGSGCQSSVKSQVAIGLGCGKDGEMVQRPAEEKTLSDTTLTNTLGAWLLSGSG